MSSMRDIAKEYRDNLSHNMGIASNAEYTTAIYKGISQLMAELWSESKLGTKILSKEDEIKTYFRTLRKLAENHQYLEAAGVLSYASVLDIEIPEMLEDKSYANLAMYNVNRHSASNDVTYSSYWI